MDLNLDTTAPSAPGTRRSPRKKNFDSSYRINPSGIGFQSRHETGVGNDQQNAGPFTTHNSNTSPSISVPTSEQGSPAENPRGASPDIKYEHAESLDTIIEVPKETDEEGRHSREQTPTNHDEKGKGLVTIAEPQSDTKGKKPLRNLKSQDLVAELYREGLGGDSVMAELRD